MGRCGTRTVQSAYSAHCGRISIVEPAGEQTAQDVWDIIGFDEVIRIREGTELLV